MKNIYRLLSAAILCLFTFALKAQNIDTTGLQKNTNGTISFAHVSNVKMANAISFLKNVLQATGKDSFILQKENTDELGMVHQRYQQYYNGIKVENAEYMLHGRNGSIETMNGDFQIVKIASVIPTLSEQQALTEALNYVNAKEYKWQDPLMEQFIKKTTNNPDATYYPKGELVIEKDYLKDEKNLLLSWKFSISSFNPNNEQWIYVDANTGEIINATPKMLDTNTPLTAQTMYNIGTFNITGDSYTGGYRLRETRNGVNVQTLNLHGISNYSNATDFTNTNTNYTNGSWTHFAQDQQALDAHWGAEKVLDFWKTVFNRNSLDGNGLSIMGYVHNPIGNNAYWDETAQKMNYGDGDGITFRPLTSLDVCAHEMGHGINEFTANLTYSKESGALNEGFSDIWGASIEHWAAPTKQTWLIGEDVTITQAALRSMSNPKQFGQPDTYLGTNWYNQMGCSPTQGNDYCGVHTNSGVLNHWYYLLSQGGNDTNDLGHAYNIAGIGINEAEQIAWRTESHYLTSSSNYATTRTESIIAAQDLFGVGSCEEIAVTNAWYAVGVGAAYSGNAGLSISGAALFCTTSNPYTIPNLPAGATVAWSASPSGIVTINTPNAVQTTLTKTGNGSVTLSASITTPCISMPVVVSKNIYAGLPAFNGSPAYHTDYGGPYPLLLTLHDNSPIPNEICERHGGFTDINMVGATSIVWSKPNQSPGASVTWFQDSYNDLNFWIHDAGDWAAFKLTYGNQCGSNDVTYKFKAITCDPYPPHSDIVTGNQFTIAPNPASGSITVSQNSKSTLSKTETGKTGIIQVSITDVSGIVKKQQQFAANTTNMKMDVSALAPGTYFVLISNGGIPETQQLFIYR